VRDAAVAAWLASQDSTAPGPWATLGGFRVMENAGRPARLFLEVHGDTETHGIEVTGTAARFVVDDGDAVTASIRDGTISLRSDGRTARFATAQDEGAILLSAHGQAYTRRIVPVVEAATGPRAAIGGPRLTAPMPGLVVAVEVAAGDRVVPGQVVVVMEAMKVVMRLPAPVGGRVLRVACTAGETVKGGDLLIEIEPDGEA